MSLRSSVNGDEAQTGTSVLVSMLEAGSEKLEYPSA